MAARDPIEEVLYRTAEIARNGPYGWMRRQSTRLLVQTSAGRLTAVIAHDDDLRSRVRKYMVKNQQWALEALVFGFDIDQFKQEVEEGNATPRTVAAGLVHESPEVAHLAADLVEAGEIHPEAASKSGAPGSPPPDLPVEAAPNAEIQRLEIEQLEERIQELLSEVDSIQKERESATAQVEQLRAEVERLENEVKAAQERANSLQDEVESLRESLPSKRQQKKQNRELRRAQRYLEEREDLLARVKRAEQERVEAVQEVAAIRAEAEEMELALREKARRHKRARTALEQSLATDHGRAEYLLRSIESELADAERQLEEMPHGPPKTRLTRRVQALKETRELICALYPIEEDRAESEPQRIEVVATYDVRVVPLGGGTEIGGSAILVEGGGQRVLVDAGLRPQAETMEDMGPPGIEEALRGRLDAVFVTHAHTDHSGFIPAVVAQHPSVKVIGSSGTAALLPTMWDDSQKVSEKRAAALSEYIPTLPLYGETEVEAAEDRIEVVRFGQTKVLGDMQFELFPAGHIVGAAGVVLRFGDRRVVITGDISDEDQATVGGARIPKSAQNADLLLIESTYCHDVRPPRENQAADFVSGIEKVVEARGRVLIPAFGLGRAQEVALLLKEHLGEIPVLIDGLAGRISRVFEAHAAEEGQRLEIFGNNVRQIESFGHRERELRTFSTGVVVTTSGMMNGGPAIRWAQEILPDPRSALYLCGYQDEESPGSALLSLAGGSGQKTFSLPSNEGPIPIKVNAQVDIYRLSAHADRNGLTDIIQEVAPRRTMLVHGYPRNQRSFAQRLEERQLKVTSTAPWSSR